MAILAGNHGNVKVGTNTVAHLKSWEWTPTNDILDSTEFGDDWKTKLTGLKDAQIKASGMFDYTDTNGQKALILAFISGGDVTLNLYTDDTHYLISTAKVKSPSVKVGVADIETIDFDFENNGAPDLTHL